MRNRITAFLFIVILIIAAAGNWVNFYQNRQQLMDDLKGETDLAGSIEDLNQYIEENIYGEYGYVEAYGVLQQLMFKHEFNAFDTVIDKQGYLHSGNFYAGFGDDQRKIAVNIRRLSDKAEQEGSRFVFVMTPMKTALQGNQYTGIPYNDYTKLADDLLRYLRYYNVDNIDLREVMEQSGLTYDEIFYKTDHHWKTAAAFEGYKAILDWIEDDRSSKLFNSRNTRDLKAYRTVTYENLMFGSQGRDTGLFYAKGRENFEVYFPDNDSLYSVKKGSMENYEMYEGKYSDVILRDHLEAAVRNVYEDSCYDLMFLHGLSDYLSITNLENPEGVKILMLRDSYASPIGCFMAQNCGQLDMIYMLGNDKENILEMIEENQYDYVIMCIYPENLSLTNLQVFEDVDYE